MKCENCAGDCTLNIRDEIITEITNIQPVSIASLRSPSNISARSFSVFTTLHKLEYTYKHCATAFWFKLQQWAMLVRDYDGPHLL